ncbi:MAG TPA: nucleotide exchange factor GrpE [Actinomycetales bacterium]|nr:nucleotide exchange factor GrpE [Actinomycetales bacterium]
MTDSPQGRPRDADGEEPTGPVVRDRRRIDPDTGEVRTQPSDLSGPAPAPAAAEPDSSGGGLGDEAARLAEERLADLQRLQAEYVNYRRRVDRDRDVARGGAVAGVLESLLPVLDDVHLAREHGDLEAGPFSAIAEKLEAVLERHGLVRYGEVGEPFDPAVHDALMHSHAEDVDVTTVVQVIQPGYRAGEKVLRAARVAVADPH